jgi:hypothetical protein
MHWDLRGMCFIIISNVFKWCVTLGNRVHGISTETGLKKWWVVWWSIIFAIWSFLVRSLHIDSWRKQSQKWTQERCHGPWRPTYIARCHIFWRRPLPCQIQRVSGKRRAKKHGVVLFNNGAKAIGAELRDLASIHLTQQHDANALGAVVT